MAKPTLLKLALVVVLTMAASTAFAAATAFTGATFIGGSTSPTSFSASNKVTVYGDSNVRTAGDFTSTAYAIAAAHVAGDKAIAAKSGDSSLYFTSTTAGAATGIASAIATSTTLSGSWTSM